MDMKFSEDDLIKYNKKALVALLLSQQQTMILQEHQLKELNSKMDLLIEQLTISNQQRFGRSSEKIDLEEQLAMCFNEAEVTIANLVIVEPELEEVTPRPYTRKKTKGKRDEDLRELPVNVILHEISEDDLKEKFPDGWKQLPHEIYKRLNFIPSRFEVEEHHIAVYAGKDNETMIKANRPVDLLRNSIVTPSLEAAILNAKYVNAMPLYRLEQEFARQDIKISRQVMANWTIRCAERYFSVFYDRLRDALLEDKVIQADETPVEVSKDGRSAGSKSYMWVYRTGKMSTSPPIVLYEYQKTRNASHPQIFLDGYKGTLVTDGYQVYHKISNENPDIHVAGCWSHARRRFANVVKALGKEKSKNSLANDALKQIALIYKTDNELLALTPEDRLHRRLLLVKPLVEAFFQWVRKHQPEVPANSETGKGFTYCLNQEIYLKEFLKSSYIPLDNNAAESVIRPFCIGKKNWRLIDTIDGAKASATIYSIAETAKANNLKPYQYFKYLLEEIPKHMDDKDQTFLEHLLPWSTSLPDECKKNNQ